ncbi:GNAT family N-acetyltransferase [Streptantibioticus silvisoli]|uniref:GNAT family N-acetyltransferase n=1 Tax=Streptantibioticus silvisoli TaxID=2705255 RepID=A0ABT6WB27_9ACTN|nr:GNAT family N-acetyltransferase [Streptantibioticus silvisoli]MDI5967681.1 GNAT family N-acetyltransferase [Streptantibioticus silvisoli]
MESQAENGYRTRAVRTEDWRQLKALRLESLRDPLSRIAFGSTYEREVAFGDEVWRGRAARAGGFVALDGDGAWVGTVTVLLEPGEAWLVGMYVRPAQRGSGVAERLVRAGADWAWERPDVSRVRLWVTEVNDRAYALYRRLGFVATGATEPHEPVPGLLAHELALSRP